MPDYTHSPGCHFCEGQSRLTTVPAKEGDRTGFAVRCKRCGYQGIPQHTIPYAWESWNVEHGKRPLCEHNAKLCNREAICFPGSSFFPPMAQ